MDLRKLIDELTVQVQDYFKDGKLTQEQMAVALKELDALRIGDPDPQKSDLDWVNFACIFLKVGLNVYWADKEDFQELDFFIEHKSNSRGRQQTEEIEPAINRIDIRAL